MYSTTNFPNGLRTPSTEEVDELNGVASSERPSKYLHLSCLPFLKINLLWNASCFSFPPCPSLYCCHLHQMLPYRLPLFRNSGQEHSYRPWAYFDCASQWNFCPSHSRWNHLCHWRMLCKPSSLTVVFCQQLDLYRSIICRMVWSSTNDRYWICSIGWRRHAILNYPKKPTILFHPKCRSCSFLCWL